MSWLGFDPDTQVATRTRVLVVLVLAGWHAVQRGAAGASLPSSDRRGPGPNV